MLTTCPGPLSYRLATPNDVSLLAELMQSVSERTRELRYVLPRRRFTLDEARAEARRLTQIDPARQAVLVAVICADDQEEAIGVAEYARADSQTSVAEVGVLVRDEYQRQGIGSALLRYLWHMGQTQGITTLSAYILPENEPIRRLIRRLGVEYTAVTRHGLTELLFKPART